MSSTLKQYLVNDGHMNQGNAAHSASCPGTWLHRLSQVFVQGLGLQGVHRSSFEG